ncbi:hypothetical protein BH11PSE2_BH11PSE2_09430 [soil metagenome]
MRLLGLTTAAVLALGATAAFGQTRPAPIPPAAPAAPAGTTAEGAKAGYLSRFGPFAEWPASAFDTPQSPLVICVVGADPFGPKLDESVKDQTFEGRAMVVRRLEKVEKASACQIAFIVGGAGQTPAEALTVLRGAPVLTVTDEKRSSQARGIIHFVTQDERQRFIIDDQAAAQNHIVLSSKLKSLALSVKARE